MLTTATIVGHLLHFLSPKIWPPNVELSFCQVHCPCKKSLLHYRCARRTDFVAKYTSMIFVGCCVVYRPVGSILVSKESHRPAVYTTRKIWKKIVKHNFGIKKQNRGHFLGHPVNGGTIWLALLVEFSNL